MLKTTFTGKGRLGLLLCLTGLLSFTTLTTATAVRAQDDGRPADNTMAGPDGTTPQDDRRYNNPKLIFSLMGVTGILLIAVIIYGVGSVVDRPFARWAFNMMEGLFQEVPIIKTVYVAIKILPNFSSRAGARNPIGKIRRIRN